MGKNNEHSQLSYKKGISRQGLCWGLWEAESKAMLGRTGNLQAGVGGVGAFTCLGGGRGGKGCVHPAGHLAFVFYQCMQQVGNSAAQRRVRKHCSLLGFKCSAIGTVLHLGHRDPSQKDVPSK